MAQHDYVIANGTGAAVRSDLNNALAAIVSQNSGATAPATTYAFQFWADTTTGLLKLRNSANSAWITLFQLDGEWSTLPVENGSAAAPSIYFKDSGTDTGFFSAGTDQVNIATAGTERLRIGASGQIGLGGANYGTTGQVLTSNGSGSAPTWQSSTSQWTTTGNDIYYTTGKVGIGTTSVDAILHTSQTTTGVATGLILENKATSGNLTSCQALFKAYDGSSVTAIGGFNALSSSFSYGTYTANSFNIASFQSGGIHLRTPNAPIVFSNNGSNIDGVGERARIDTSGRLLVGTSSTSSSALLQVQGNSSSSAGDAIIQLRRGENNVSILNGESLGSIQFSNSESTVSAVIEAVADANWNTTNDYPSRLVFSTTADGASSPTERLRIANNGAWGLAGANYGSSGQVLTSNGSGSAPTWSAASGVATLATPVASTSGTSIDFTSIPSTVKRVVVMFQGVSTNGSSRIRIQLGDSGGIETSGYEGTATRLSGATIVAISFSAGFDLYEDFNSSLLVSGTMTFSLLSSSANTWTGEGMVGTSNGTNVYSFFGAKSLSATLDRVRITTANGTDAFDAGTINIMYES